MSTAAKDKWLKFFLDAKIPKSAAEEYTLTFVENRIQSDMLLDLDKDYLNAMGITVMGDIIAILKHAKVCHVQNAKKNMLSKKPSGSSLANSNRPTGLSANSNYRSVCLKKSQPPEVAKSTVSTLKPVAKQVPVKIQSKVQTNKIVPATSLARSSSVKSSVSNETKPVMKSTSSKPILVRTHLVRKRSSSELSKQSAETEKPVEDIVDHENASSSESASDESVDEITQKMAKKSIFDRLGNQNGKNPVVDSSERAVSSSTSAVSSTTVAVTKSPPPKSTSPSNGPKPGTVSYRMFSSHVHSTSSNDDVSDVTTPDEEDDRILIEVDLNEPQQAKTTRQEFTVALPPDIGAASKPVSVFDRLGGRKAHSIATPSNPGKSILKISSTSLRINKPSSPLNLLPDKRDFKSLSTLNTKLSLIRSQVKTEGVLGKPASAQEKLSAKARIGTTRNLSTSTDRLTAPTSSRNQLAVPTPTRIQHVPPSSSVKSRLCLSEKKLDVLVKKTLSSTPAHVKARIESEQQPFLSKAKCGSGIKARLGFKTREKVLNFDSSDLRIHTDSP